MAISVSNRPFTGRDLMAERVRLSLRAADVAHRMGVSRQRVTNIEQLHRVHPALAERYLRALEAENRTTDVPTTPAAPKETSDGRSPRTATG